MAGPKIDFQRYIIQIHIVVFAGNTKEKKQLTSNSSPFKTVKTHPFFLRVNFFLISSFDVFNLAEVMLNLFLQSANLVHFFTHVRLEVQLAVLQGGDFRLERYDMFT